MGDDPSVVQVQVEEQNEKGELSSQKKERDEKDSGYEDFDAFDEEPEDSDMEGSILNRPRPKKPAKPPAVPARSDKRASKILENVMLELKSLDGSVSTKEAEQQSIVSDPHELYLSSEEDASLSDDYEDVDSLVDFEASPASDGDGEESKPSSRASSRRSQEDTARVVSFTLVTKPQIIQINIPPTAAQKRHSMNLENLTHSTSYIPKAPRRPTPLKLYPSTRRMSLASVNSSNGTPFTHHSNQSLTSLPPRKSSKLSNISNIMTNAKNSFLASDPFASPARNGEDGDEEAQETPITPKTPTSMASAAWKKSLSRTMSKARKPSMPKISLAYTAGVVNRDSRLAMQLAAEESREAKNEKEAEKKERGSEERAQVQRSATMPVQEGPVRYEDILRNAIKAPPPQSEGKEKEKDKKMSMTSKMGMGFGLSRRKSIKGRGDRYMG
jgi:hypothetical protein